MDKDLKTYSKEITSQIDNAADSNQPIEHLLTLFKTHTQRVQEFQHERHMHLIVTLFFSAVMLMCFVALIILLSFNVLESGALLLILLTALTCLLLATVLFYIYHYYKLENGTQHLYLQTKRLADLIARCTSKDSE